MIMRAISCTVLLLASGGGYTKLAERPAQSVGLAIAVDASRVYWAGDKKLYASPR